MRLLSVNHLFQRAGARQFSNIKQCYLELVNSNKIMYDENQYKVVKTMSKLEPNMMQYFENRNDKNLTNQRVRGLYIWGEVGTGKTFLMDLLYNSISLPQKRRVHFHKFMLEVHQMIHQFKQELLATYGRDVNLNMMPDRDAIEQVAKKISQTTWLLCFDEFQVTDIVNALIMTKLFNELWKQGTILIATSNRPSNDLYQGGINRSYFLPFIDALNHNCLHIDMKSRKDYRLLSSQQLQCNFYPATLESNSKLYNMFAAQIHEQYGHDKAPQDVIVPIMMGRSVKVRGYKDICFVDFSQMCEEYRGAADYSAISKHMKHIYMTNIPVFSVLEHDKARRFITLIDEVYDGLVRFYWTSAMPCSQLFRLLTPGDIADNDAGQKIFGTDHSWASSDIINGEKSAPAATDPSSRPHPKYESNPFDCIRINKQFQVPESSSSKSDENSSTASTQPEKRELELLSGALASIQELSFAFRRASSRLAEMNTAEYALRCKSSEDML